MPAIIEFPMQYKRLQKLGNQFFYCVGCKNDEISEWRRCPVLIQGARVHQEFDYCHSPYIIIVFNFDTR